METAENVQLMPNVNNKVVEGITGFKLCAYLVALEGWRRGLTLTWYKGETTQTTLKRADKDPHGKIFSLSNGKETRFFCRSRGDIVSNEAVAICQDKTRTKKYLEELNVNTPKGNNFTSKSSAEDIINYADSIGYPVVLKPTNGSMGVGVYTNIENANQLREAFQELKKRSKYNNYIVETHHPGQEYRIYVVGDQVIGATNRVPANIIGDGLSSIEDLIKQKNKKRKENPYLSPKPIKVDYEVNFMLKQKDYNLNSVPKEDELVYLRQKSNLSSGGDPLEATDELPPEVHQMAVDALKAIPSMPHGGVDIIVHPTKPSKSVVLEINATAEIGFHLFPLTGKAKDIPSAIIDHYFPETKYGNRTSMYFDFISSIEPLRTRTVEEVKFACPLLGKLYSKKYTISGKTKNVGYMNFIRSNAYKKNIHGYVKRLNNGNVEVFIICNEKDKLDEFKEVCKKGTKRSRVMSIDEQDLVHVPLLKMGFELIV